MSSIRLLDNCLKSLNKISYASSLNRSKVSPFRPSQFPCQSWGVRSLMGRSGEPYNFNSLKMIEKLKAKDGIPPKFRLIYRSNFPSYLYMVQGGFFLMTLVGTSVLIANLYIGTPNQEKIELEEKEKHKPQLDLTGERPDYFFDTGHKMEAESTEELVYFMLGLAAFTISLYGLLRRIPIRIYGNRDKTVLGVFIDSLIPGKKSIHEFVAGTFTKVPKSTIVFTTPTGKRIYLFEDHFKYPADLEYLTNPEQDLVSEHIFNDGVENENDKKD